MRGENAGQTDGTVPQVRLRFLNEPGLFAALARLRAVDRNFDSSALAPNSKRSISEPPPRLSPQFP